VKSAKSVNNLFPYDSEAAAPGIENDNPAAYGNKDSKYHDRQRRPADITKSPLGIRMNEEAARDDEQDRGYQQNSRQRELQSTIVDRQGAKECSKDATQDSRHEKDESKKAEEGDKAPRRLLNVRSGPPIHLFAVRTQNPVVPDLVTDQKGTAAGVAGHLLRHN